MKELITVEKAAYNRLLGMKLKVDEQQLTITELRKQLRTLEERHYTLLLTNPQLAKEMVNLGNYVESVTAHDGDV